MSETTENKTIWTKLEDGSLEAVILDSPFRIIPMGASKRFKLLHNGEQKFKGSKGECKEAAERIALGFNPEVKRKDKKETVQVGHIAVDIVDDREETPEEVEIVEVKEVEEDEQEDVRDMQSICDELVWKHGLNVPEKAIREAGLDPEEVPEVMWELADQHGREKLNERHKEHNGSGKAPRVVVSGSDGPELKPRKKGKKDMETVTETPNKGKKSKDPLRNPAKSSSKTGDKGKKGGSTPKGTKSKQDPKNGEEKGRGKRSTYFLFDLPVGAILRWMGKEGWSGKDAKKALHSLGVKPSDVLVHNWLKVGRGESTKYKGDIPKLTKEQVQQLKQAAKSTKSEESEE